MKNAIEKIHEFERFGSVLGLERMNVLLEKLGNPQKELKVIHVAGTNGKGSICKYIYEVLQAGNYKTGLYTSPFIQCFNERIQYNGENISDEDLNDVTDKVLEKSKEMVDEGHESPTEFEIVTAVAFLYFKEKNTDYVVLEVGLGGIGDSTNVIKKPLVCVISSISLDHTDRLGNTISQIAREKAGIIKEGANVVVSTNKEDALKVIDETAKSLNAKVYKTCNVPYEIVSESLYGCSFDVEALGEEYHLEISMAGKHQVENAIAALYAIELIRQNNDVTLSKEVICNGFKKAVQIGRLEIIDNNPRVIIDGAHNPDGSKALAETINQYYSNKKILMIIGILADKDTNHVVENFLSITKDFVVCEPNNPRKMDGNALGKIITTKGGNSIIMKSPKDAVEYANENKCHYDLILYAGSLYLIGEVREILKNEH